MQAAAENPDERQIQKPQREDFLGTAGNGWLQVLRVQHGPESANPKNPTSESLQQVYAILLKAC